MSQAKRPLSIALLGSLLASVFSTLSWACTVQARILTIEPPYGHPKQSVEVRGTTTSPMSEVAILWNGLNGPKLGSSITDAEGRFSAIVSLPVAEPGVYSLLAWQEGVGIGRTSIEMLPGPEVAEGKSTPRSEALSRAGTAISSDTWRGFSSVKREAAPAEIQADRPNMVLRGAGASLMTAGLGGLAFSLLAMASRKSKDWRLSSESKKVKG